ncbi:hypothetical protein ZWY2020_048548 [Hordeum vulgare]|nr:hypothetical protein ZWY2020_048548 [Hordeum vulgare]
MTGSILSRFGPRLEEEGRSTGSIEGHGSIQPHVMCGLLNRFAMELQLINECDGDNNCSEALLYDWEPHVPHQAGSLHGKPSLLPA